MIARLRAAEYRFVIASRLAGIAPAQAMPKVAAGDLWAVRTDVAVFLVVAGVIALVIWLLFVAIALGIGRAVTMAALAWTAAPESFAALARHRYRWAFGMLQCLWKHRPVLRTRRP